MVWVISFLLIQFVGVCFGGGVLKLAFSQFTHNLQCDYLSTCDLKFVLCVDHVNSSATDYHEDCKYLRKDTHDLDPVSLHFKQWPGSVLLKLVILDIDLFENDLMDYLHTYLNNIPGEKVLIELKNKTRLIVKSELMCDLDYFGPNCSVSCSPRDDDTGHFKCNPQTGETICLKGWGGPKCNLRSVISSSTEYKNFSNPSATKFQLTTTTASSSTISTSVVAISTTTMGSPMMADDMNVIVNQFEDDILSRIDVKFDNETLSTTVAIDEESVNASTVATLVDLVTDSITEIDVDEWNGNYSQESLTFSFPLNDTLSSENVSILSEDRLQTSFQSVLKRYVADDMDHIKINVTIKDESLQIIITLQIDAKNETILERIIKGLIEQKSNIKNSFIKEAFINKTHPQGTPIKSKSVPEWAIILMVVAVVVIVLITMRQSHKYCVSRNLMKPKELDEEPEVGLSTTNSALNFTNPIYTRP